MLLIYIYFFFKYYVFFIKTFRINFFFRQTYKLFFMYRFCINGLLMLDSNFHHFHNDLFTYKYKKKILSVFWKSKQLTSKKYLQICIVEKFFLCKKNTQSLYNFLKNTFKLYNLKVKKIFGLHNLRVNFFLDWISHFLLSYSAI